MKYLRTCIFVLIVSTDISKFVTYRFYDKFNINKYAFSTFFYFFIYIGN